MFTFLYKQNTLIFRVKGGMQFVHEQQQYTFKNLTYFSLLFHFYTTRKRQKTKDFMKFPGGIVMERWAKTG